MQLSAADLATAKARAPRATPKAGDVAQLRRHLEQRLGGMLADRYSWWSHWREIADYLIPRRYRWLVVANQANRGSPINQRIIDNTATRSHRILAAGMMSGITSPGRPWFRLTLDDADLAKYAPVKLWLDQVADILRTILQVSNFYTSMGTFYEDVSAFGTAVMITYEDFDDVIRCYNTCAGEYFLANDARLNVTTLYRQITMTAWQVGAQFGLENVSPTVKQAWESGGAQLSKEIVIAHAIEPNEERIEGMRGPKGMPYREVYWEWGSSNQANGILSQRGFHERPFIAARWAISGNDAYGRSPAMDALGDIKQLQTEQKRKAQAIDKVVNPPMIGDIQLKNEPATLLPGGITYVTTTTNGVGFKPAYEVKPELEEMMKDIQECQSRVKATFFEDLFLMISQLDTVRTATEIDERREEKLIQLGPVLERIQVEGLDPQMDRVFNIALRSKLLPPMPRELAGQRVKVEYISMLAQAQRAAMTAGLERFSAFVGRFVSVDPTALDNIDIDEACDEYADMLGIPAKVVRAYADVMKIRRDRAKQQQAQALMEQTQAGVAGAKTLSETDVGGGQNALQMMLGNAPSFGPQ